MKTEAEKISKHEDLTAHTECKKRSYISNNGGNWEQLKSSRKYLSKIHGKHKIKELLTTAILGIAHVFREVLM
jgi:DNA repair ATPase RecN